MIVIYAAWVIEYHAVYLTNQSRVTFSLQPSVFARSTDRAASYSRPRNPWVAVQVVVPIDGLQMHEGTVEISWCLYKQMSPNTHMAYHLCLWNRQMHKDCLCHHPGTMFGLNTVQDWRLHRIQDLFKEMRPYSSTQGTETGNVSLQFSETPGVLPAQCLEMTVHLTTRKKCVHYQLPRTIQVSCWFSHLLRRGSYKLNNNDRNTSDTHNRIAFVTTVEKKRGKSNITCHRCG